MKVLKETSKHAMLFRKLEEFMEDNDIAISICCGGLEVQIEDSVYHIVDCESSEYVPELPRVFESERLCVSEWG